MSDVQPGSPPPSRPWRAALIPDTRACMILGIFGLAYKLLSMIDGKPVLLNNTAFMMVATLILGGSGLGAIVAYLFGGTKTGSEVMKAQSDAVIASTPPAVKDAA